jgi:hypothetical protein
MRLPDSERSRAVLIGTSIYADDSGFESLPSVRKNLTDLERLLRQETGLRHVTVLLDPDSPKAFGNALKNAIDEAEDLLLFYFSGHGLCVNNELALTYTQTTTMQPGYTTVPYPTIRDDIHRSPARVKLVFLDCCHSGKAFGAGTLAGDEDEILKELAVIEGAYVLTATGTKSKFARASSQSGHTAFTGALLEVLRSGTPSPDEFLSMDAVYPLLKTKLAGANLPEPKSSGRDTAAKLALVRNGRRLEVGSTRIRSAAPEPSEAERWCRPAADRGNPEAMHTLGVLVHQRGEAEEAEGWYRRAADTDYPAAMAALSVLLHRRGDVEEADRWCRRAADTGDPWAMAALGVLREDRGEVSDRAIAPPYDALRPVKPTSWHTFPMYRELGATLAGVGQQPDLTVAHTLAVAANYAYSDPETVAMMLARTGLAENHCLRVAMSVDAKFIRSTAYLIQSSDGTVVILAYRGTEPANLVTELINADVHRDKIAFPFPKTQGSDAVDATDLYAVHAGFYRNVRATRFEVVAALKRALEGRSVLDDGRGASPMPPMASRMTTLYVTGHGLGGAMAALMAVMLSVEEDYVERFAPVFKGAYTYGAPMVGSPDFAMACAAHPFLDRNVIRYIYKRDPMPHLPPSGSNFFQHFGREYRYEDSYPWKETSDDPIRQIGNVLSLIEAPLAFVARRFRLLRGLPFQFSLNDHGPQNYLAALTPPGVRSEFGD